jgi:hypothetical protein
MGSDSMMGSESVGNEATTPNGCDADPVTESDPICGYPVADRQAIFRAANCDANLV